MNRGASWDTIRSSSDSDSCQPLVCRLQVFTLSVVRATSSVLHVYYVGCKPLLCQTDKAKNN